MGKMGKMGKLSPEKLSCIYRTIGVISLYAIWGRTGTGIWGLFLLLLLVVLMLLRWRLPKLKWTLIIDQAAVLASLAVWENSGFYLTLSVFEAFSLGCPLLLGPTLVYLLVSPDSRFLLFIGQSVFCGLALWGWNRQQETSQRRLDENAKKYYELETLKEELLEANVQAAKLAELSERSRIAREIHDNAGHEIVAAYLSLQTYAAMDVPAADEQRELLSESLDRLENGVSKIREAVHNLAPLIELGVHSLQKLCDSFPLCPALLTIYGDSSTVPVHLWIILESCLKESLTNILRHSQAKTVTAELTIAPHIVRLCVENDGVKNDSLNNGDVENNGMDSCADKIPGIGLRNLSQRARAAGGSITVDNSAGYRLVCVLPKEAL